MTDILHYFDGPLVKCLNIHARTNMYRYTYVHAYKQIRCIECCSYRSTFSKHQSSSVTGQESGNWNDYVHQYQQVQISTTTGILAAALKTGPPVYSSIHDCWTVPTVFPSILLAQIFKAYFCSCIHT